MAIKFVCNDYGFDCNFSCQGDNSSELIDEFARHTAEVHGIEYSKEALMQFIIRKT